MTKRSKGLLIFVASLAGLCLMPVFLVLPKGYIWGIPVLLVYLCTLWLLIVIFTGLIIRFFYDKQ